MTDRQLEELQDQLNKLRLKHDRVLDKIVQLQKERKAAQDAADTLGARAFRIGDRVRVRNPNPKQPREGKVTKITKERVTLTSDSGIDVWRAPKNLELLE